MKPAIEINNLVLIARDNGVELYTYDDAFDAYIQEYGEDMPMIRDWKWED